MNTDDGKLVLDVAAQLYGVVLDTQELRTLLCSREQFNIGLDSLLLLGKGECRKGECECCEDLFHKLPRKKG